LPLLANAGSYFLYNNKNNKILKWKFE
jgi:hypothetical protein